MATRKDPYQAYRFKVEIDGIQRAGFKEASGLESTNDVVEYREGDKPSTVTKLSGLTKYGNITLKGGVTDDVSLIEWKKKTIDGQTERKNGSIILCNDAGEEKIRWNFKEAWISKWSIAGFNATTNDVAIETVEIVHEGLVKG